MNSSLLRMIAGYSRFALQEERKHDMRTGVFMVKNLPLLPYQRVSFLSQPIKTTLSMDTMQQPRAHKINIPNLSLQVSENNNKVTVIGHMLNQRTENQINTIQYQANNGIQDRLVATTLRSIEAQTISVFDGHGGDKLSDYCANQIVELIDSFIQKNKKLQIYYQDIDRLITDALAYAYTKLDSDFYENVYKSLVAANNRKIKNIGTCALTIILYDRKIYVANCGDSQAIVVSKHKNNKISYTPLNDRLSVNNPAERERLRKQFPHDEDIVVEEQNGCFYIKGRLQPTRALGDYHLKYEHLFKGKGKYNGPYINGVPDIKIFPIRDDYKSIVVASDGVWDFLTKKVVAQASLQYNPHEAILQKTLDKIADIHKKSVDQIKEVATTERRAFHDDISIAVVSLGKINKTQQVL